jgi:hypothetical protein
MSGVEQARKRSSFDYTKFNKDCDAVIADKKANAPLIQFVQRVAQEMQSRSQWPIPVTDLSTLHVWGEVGVSRDTIKPTIEALVITHKTISPSLNREGTPVINELRTLALASLIGSLRTSFPGQKNVFLGDLVSQTQIYIHPLPLADLMHLPDETKKQQYDKVKNPFAREDLYG